MSDIRIKEDEIIKDINAILSDYDTAQNERKSQIDFRKHVGDVLDRHNMPYTLDEQSGYLKIEGPQDCFIECRWNGISYNPNFCITYNGISKEYGKYTSSSILLVEFESYIPILKGMISKMEKLVERYDAQTKEDKNSQLLTILVENYMKEAKLTDVIMEPVPEHLSDYYLRKKITGNIYLRLRLNFGNYEQQCRTFVSAAKLIPRDMQKGIWRDLKFERVEEGTSYEKLKECKGRVRLTEEGCVTMRYKNPSEIKCPANKGDFGMSDTLREFLTKSGFIFYNNDDILYVLLDEKTRAYRRAKYLGFTDYENVRGTVLWAATATMPEEQFIQMLRMIATASTAGESTRNYLASILIEHLPSGYFVESPSFFDSFRYNKLNLYFRNYAIKSIKKNPAKMMLEIIKHADCLYSIPDLWRDFPDVEIVLQE